MSTKNSSRVKKLHTYLRSLARRRASRVVTADDAQNYLNKQGMPRNMTNARLSVINSVFGSGDFEPVGRVKSTRPESKGRTITEWSIS